ncbi:MAG: hypothetical protein SGPRY_011307 [Prymnesium sp.]
MQGGAIRLQQGDVSSPWTRQREISRARILKVTGALCPLYLHTKLTVACLSTGKDVYVLQYEVKTGDKEPEKDEENDGPRGGRGEGEGEDLHDDEDGNEE